MDGWWLLCLRVPHPLVASLQVVSQVVRYLFLYGRRLLVVVFDVVFDVTIMPDRYLSLASCFPLLTRSPFPPTSRNTRAGRAFKASLRAINYHRASDDQCSTGDRPSVFPRSFPGFKVHRMSPGCSSNRLPDEKCVCLFTVLAFFRIRASRSTTTVAEYKSCLRHGFFGRFKPRRQYLLGDIELYRFSLSLFSFLHIVSHSCTSRLRQKTYVR